MAHETLEGTGKLRRIGIPPLAFDVTYHLDIITSVIAHPGIPAMVRGRSRSQGTITSVTNEFIPGGEYDLETEDGETLRVKNLGVNHWHILAS